MMKLVRFTAVILAFALLMTIAVAEPELYGKEQLVALMSNLPQDIQPGAAGCALRSTARAAELMKWGMNTKMTETEIAETAREVIAGIPEDAMPDYREAMNEVYDAYCTLLTDDGKAVLEDAGLNSAEYDFDSVESVEVVEIVMEAVGLNG